MIFGTPRTDYAEIPASGDQLNCLTVVRSNLARQLERELAALRADVAKCHEAIGEDPGSDTSELWKFFQGHNELLARLEKAEAQRDRLAGALEILIRLDDEMNDEENPEKGTYAGAYYAYYKGEFENWKKARQALDELKGPQQ